MKNLNHNNTNQILERLKEIENMAGQPAFDLNLPEEIKVNIRVNESIGPAKFKPDPLIPGGFMANSLTIRAMRSDLFVVGESLEDLVTPYLCACSNEFDIQFWRICPHCGRDINS